MKKILFLSLCLLCALSGFAQLTRVNLETTAKGTLTAGDLFVSDGDNTGSWQSDASVDNQTLSLSGTNLSITNGNTINISSINTDAQTLSLSGNNLSITGGNTIDISSINTDAQTLSLSGNNLSITGGNTINLSSISSGTDYYQVFDNVTGNSVTVTVNGGTLPGDVTQIIVDRPGIRCAPTQGGTTRDFSVSGSVITFTEPLQAERVQIRFNL